MGNAASCAPSMAWHGGATRVASTDGATKLYARPIKAAELMLENPGKFVCDAGALSVGHRILGLPADAELARRRLYLLLPVELLYSVLTQEEMASFTSSSSSSSSSKGVNARSDSSGGRYGNLAKNMLPSLGEFCMFVPKMSDDGEEDEPESCESVKRVYSKQRSWTPALDTIVEAPTSCRSC